ncbi:MAG TPA: TonB family protein [Methylophilaceae bacterium]|nr:TonB family protein [Methylophilaceae bacterium]
MSKQLDKFFNAIEKLSPMTIAVGFSLLVHIIFLAIKFEPELKELVQRLPSLEVVLVNAKTKNAPKIADVIAQANLDRGGNTDLDRQMKTMLPTNNNKQAEVRLQANKQQKEEAKSAKLEAREARERKHVAELEKKANELFTQLESTKKLESKPIEHLAAIEPEDGQQKQLSKLMNREALLAASLEIDRLEAQIAKQQEEYQKRPKRRFLGSRAKAADDALYLEAWRQKIERIGNMNYPAAARNQKLYGKLQLTVSIRADGTVEDVSIDKSSGSKILDEAALNIVSLAAPYAKFSQKMRKTTDILSITRTWMFTQEDALFTH